MSRLLATFTAAALLCVPTSRRAQGVADGNRTAAPSATTTVDADSHVRPNDARDAELHGLTALVFEDRDGTLWVSTGRGIARLTRDRIDDVAAGRRASLDPIILGRGDGLRNVEGAGGGLDPSGLRDRDGRLWFSTIDGITVVDPDAFPARDCP